MPAPILALPSSSTSKTHNLKPNILPTRIHHNGPIKVSKHHWNPSSSSSTSSFRGRKLLAQTLVLPEKYTGLILQKTDATSQQDEEEDVKEVKTIGSFSDVVIWGHEVQPDRKEDVYVRGVEEWIWVAEGIHAYDEEDRDGEIGGKSQRV
ncbi:hypothetical protein AC578_5120 [Pseudocercospora eumusae]|uniref:Uncharacterized protein n=1 Tax=Pseudocercospora eumusae TaxID=321146 RepID=A0A139GUG2_9PEZI|nr:hypothetical protein AC578_5120 [Pseudocercospora eumusae]